MTTEGMARELEKLEKFTLSFLKFPCDRVSLLVYKTKFKWFILLYIWYSCFNVSIVRIVVWNLHENWLTELLKLKEISKITCLHFPILSPPQCISHLTSKSVLPETLEVKIKTTLNIFKYIFLNKIFIFFKIQSTKLTSRPALPNSSHTGINVSSHN